jgi:hypothetical protein
MCGLELELNNIPFFSIRDTLKHAIMNYKNGLKIIREGLIKSVIGKAEILAKIRTKNGRALSTEQVIYYVYREIVSTSYLTAERFLTDVTMLAKAKIPPELYYWLFEIPKHFNVKKIIVFQEGARFATETFNQKIIYPLRSLIDLASTPEVPGSLIHTEKIDLLKTNPIKDGYVISCVRGEAQNPVLWPILCHEMFEIIDKEQNLFKNFQQFVSAKGTALPILDSNQETNRHWILEIFMDFLAINSFGPMYAKSLLEYFKRSPYYQTFEHPEMSFRLFSTYQFLKTPYKNASDIFGRCQAKAQREVEKEIKAYEEEGELDSVKERELASLYSLMSQFLGTIKMPLFLDRLMEYNRQSGNPEVTLSEMLKDERQIIPFQDPLLDYDDIKNNILYHHISLAIDPNIMLNVILAEYDLYQEKEHLSVIVDSIRKWKIKQVWNHFADALMKHS